jgi:hypothetical protein
MSKADQFRQNSDKAMSWPRPTITEEEKQALIELARRWTQAALQGESSAAVSSSPPEQKAPPLLIFYGPF